MTDKTAIEKARDALKKIAKRDWVENALSPQWAASVARDTLAALEAEKPAEEVRVVAGNIIGMAMADYTGLERQLENDIDIASDMIQSYAETYYAAKCKACKALPDVNE